LRVLYLYFGRPPPTLFFFKFIVLTGDWICKNFVYDFLYLERWIVFVVFLCENRIWLMFLLLLFLVTWWSLSWTSFFTVCCIYSCLLFGTFQLKLLFWLETRGWNWSILKFWNVLCEHRLFFIKEEKTLFSQIS